jgi:hypothetical protein
MRAPLLTALVGGLAWLLGCSDPAQEPPRPTAPRSAAQVAPDALQEGRIEAFGLRLPEGSAIKRRTPSTITVEVPAELEKTVAYVRERTAGTERRKGKRVFIEDAGSAPKLRVVLRATTMTTEVSVSLVEVPEEPISDDTIPAPSASTAPSVDVSDISEIQRR